jgi:hypothetical protein
MNTHKRKLAYQFDLELQSGSTSTHQCAVHVIQSAVQMATGKVMLKEAAGWFQDLLGRDGVSKGDRGEETGLRFPGGESGRQYGYEVDRDRIVFGVCSTNQSCEASAD